MRPPIYTWICKNTQILCLLFTSFKWDIELDTTDICVFIANLGIEVKKLTASKSKGRKFKKTKI